MTTQMEQDKQVAQTIANQLGNLALSMVGAKNLHIVRNEFGSGLSFRIGRNSKRVNRVEIVLTPTDTYRLEFSNISKYKYDVLHVSDDIYFDMLHEVIENHTGMYLSL